MTQEEMFHVKYWKYCSKCGTELQRQAIKDPFRYDLINRKPYYQVQVFCPNTKGDTSFVPPYHTYTTYEVTDIENVKLIPDELPF